MSSWGVQLVIGRLVTDEAFRLRFEACTRDSLTLLCQQGIALTDNEVAALAETDLRLWAAVARCLDHRLRERGSSRDEQKSASAPSRPLTERERRVLRGIFEGRTNKQIGLDLGVSESAVKATLQQGLNSQEHVDFVARLEQARTD